MSVPTFASIRELSASVSGDVWGEVVAPYVASKMFECHQVEAYEDVRLIPPELENYTNEILTLLVRKRSSKKVSRVYLWVGTREEAKLANCLIESGTGRFVVVQSVVPHEVEFYNKYEIIQESDDGGMFADLEVNKILVSTPSSVKRLDKDSLVDLIQSATEAFVLKLMELEDGENDILGLYVTVRVMRRGKPTLFDEIDVLIGNAEEIRALRESEDSDSGSDSDYGSSGDRAERHVSSSSRSASDDSTEETTSSSSESGSGSGSDESASDDDDDDEDEDDEDASSESSSSEELSEADEDRMMEEAKIMTLLPMFNEFIDLYSPEQVSDASLRVLLDKMKLIGSIRLEMFDDADDDLSTNDVTDADHADSALMAIMAALNRTNLAASTASVDKDVSNAGAGAGGAHDEVDPVAEAATEALLEVEE